MPEYRIGRLQGRYVIYWWDGGKRRRYRLDARTRKEAEAEARDRILREHHAPGGMTVAGIWEDYRAERAGRSIAESMTHTGKSVLPWFGAMRPDQITTADCRAYIADRRAAGRADGTIWTQLNHLRIALGWAAKVGRIERAPHIERPAAPSPRERYLTRAEIDRLLAADCAPHIHLAIMLMLSTAARVSAILELTWQRVDLDRGQINLRTGEGQRKGRAVVPINAGLRAALVGAREAALTDHVIEHKGKPVASIKKGFAVAARNAGLDGVSPHVLRHTAAVHMAEAGVPMDEISQYLGHSNTRVTASVYARFSPEHLRRAADVLDFAKVRKVQ